MFEFLKREANLREFFLKKQNINEALTVLYFDGKAIKSMLNQSLSLFSPFIYLHLYDMDKASPKYGTED